MARVGRPLALVWLVLAATLAGGLVAGSAQPGPFCGICGERFHDAVTTSHATLTMTEEGDVHWRVENRVASESAAGWPNSSRAAERRAREKLDEFWYVELSNPGNLSADVTGDTVVVTFVDRGAARHRLGLLVLPYFHGEGDPHRWVVNAEKLVVEAPHGHRIVNDPSGADVAGNRVVWTGSSRGVYGGPEPGDAYVIAGEGATAGGRGAVVATLIPLDPTLYGFYGAGALFVIGLAFGIYTIQGTRLGPRSVAFGLAVTAVPYLLTVAVAHPPSGGGWILLTYTVFGSLVVLVLGLVGGMGLYVAAGHAAADPEVRPE